MPVAEPPCGACCYACSDGKTDLGLWLHLPEVIIRAVAGLVASAPRGRWRSGSALASLAIGMIKGYQLRISARTPARCRFVPTCSTYGLIAIEGHGVLKGWRMTYRRLTRCRASVAFGTADPVPLLPGTR
ncbi:membrane protein insertion efficiency factor YidD [Asanoa sp. NPDC049573]|uniref:membrane protein insertion efficiency factor YidD n=1 Tax=Asanoa sp. NPDC049573 TaxID=3155396 RepID=UPI00342A40AE